MGLIHDRWAAYKAAQTAGSPSALGVQSFHFADLSTLPVYADRQNHPSLFTLEEGSLLLGMWAVILSGVFSSADVQNMLSVTNAAEAGLTVRLRDGQMSGLSTINPLVGTGEPFWASPYDTSHFTAGSIDLYVMTVSQPS